MAPWGGRGYKKHKRIKDLPLGDSSLKSLCLRFQGHVRFAVLKLPINFDFIRLALELNSPVILKHEEVNGIKPKPKILDMEALREQFVEENGEGTPLPQPAGNTDIVKIIAETYGKMLVVMVQYDTSKFAGSQN